MRNLNIFVPAKQQYHLLTSEFFIVGHDFHFRSLISLLLQNFFQFLLGHVEHIWTASVAGSGASSHPSFSDQAQYFFNGSSLVLEHAFLGLNQIMLLFIGKLQLTNTLFKHTNLLVAFREFVLDLAYLPIDRLYSLRDALLHTLFQHRNITLP